MLLFAFKIVEVNNCSAKLVLKIANLERQMGERFLILVFLAP